MAYKIVIGLRLAWLSFVSDEYVYCFAISEVGQSYYCEGCCGEGGPFHDTKWLKFEVLIRRVR